MQVCVVVKYILLYIFAAAQLRAVNLFFVGIVEVIPLVYIVICAAVFCVNDRGKSVSAKIAYIVSIGSLIFGKRRSVQYQAVLAADLFISAFCKRRFRSSVQGHAAGEEVRQQIDGAVISLDHSRVNESSSIGVLCVCAVIEIIREAVCPCFPAVFRFAEDGVKGARIACVVPACIDRSQKAAVVKGDQRRDTEIRAPASAGGKGLILCRAGGSAAVWQDLRLYFCLLIEIYRIGLCARAPSAGSICEIISCVTDRSADSVETVFCSFLDPECLCLSAGLSGTGVDVYVSAVRGLAFDRIAVSNSRDRPCMGMGACILRHLTVRGGQCVPRSIDPAAVQFCGPVCEVYDPEILITGI